MFWRRSVNKKKRVVAISRQTDIVAAYRLLLEVKRPDLLPLFDQRLKDCPGSARLEAITFTLLDNWFRLQPSVYEDPAKGGPDFEARHSLHRQLFVEVKYLQAEAVAQKSGLAKEGISESGWFSFITPKLEEALKDAARQLGNMPGPGICVIGSDHPEAGMLMGAFAASTLLTSESHIEIPISNDGGPAGDARVVTDLKSAAFMRPSSDPGEELRSMRRSISAVILVAFNYEASTASIVGLLHHDAARPLDWRVFEGVPFARFGSAPAPGAEANVEFVISHPKPLGIPMLLPVELKESDLRGEDKTT